MKRGVPLSHGPPTQICSAFHHERANAPSQYPSRPSLIAPATHRHAMTGVVEGCDRAVVETRVQ